uniref:ASNS protein n=1 Tax=Homo sapiens TaxID=9606 RepID=V9GZN1_HUMAN|nr:ORF; putative [Homo sapiens]
MMKLPARVTGARSV